MEELPFRTKQWCSEVEGIRTEFILSTYSNQLFFVITQLEKLGTLIEARADLSLEGDSTTFTVNTLLGKRDPSLEVYARELISFTSQTSPKPLLLSIALKQTSPSIFKTILEQIKKNIL